MIIRKLEALFTINTNTAQFKKATQQLETLSDKVEGIMKAVAGYWAVQALQNFVINTSNAMAELGRSSQYLGIAAQALQELQFAAEKSGVSVDALYDSIKELQVRAFDAKSGEGEAAEAFQALGVKATDAAGRIREPLELLDEVADKFLKLPTHSDRLWVADAMFGDEGATILKMLHEGSSGLHRMRQEARALGVVLSENTIQEAHRLNQALKQLSFAQRSFNANFVSELLPGLSWFAEKLSRVAIAVNTTRVSTSFFNIALGSLAATLSLVAAKAAVALTPMLIAAAPLIAKVALLGAGFVVAIALAEDLWVALKGGDSVFGDLKKSLDAFFAPFERLVFDIPKRFTESIGSMGSAIDSLVPDFVKKGFLATIQHTLPQESVAYGPTRELQSRWVPQPVTTSQNRLINNQSVNVAVNVKSGADPHEIAGEASKAVRKELERERFNAFMGVTQYAG